MGFFSKIFKPIKKVFKKVKSIFRSPTAAPIVSYGLDYLRNRSTNKIQGLPTPPSGAELGRERRDFLENAYPGTNPWEQLGSAGTAGQIGSAMMNADAQRKLQFKEQVHQRALADRQNIAQIISSTASISPQALNSAMEAYRYGKSPEFNTTTDSQILRNKYGSPFVIAGQGVEAIKNILKNASKDDYNKAKFKVKQSRKPMTKRNVAEMLILLDKMEKRKRKVSVTNF